MKKTVTLDFVPGDKVYIKDERFVSIIERIVIDDDITYEWYSLDHGLDVIEVWNEGSFTKEDIGKTVFASYVELLAAYPEVNISET